MSTRTDGREPLVELSDFEIAGLAHAAGDKGHWSSKLIGETPLLPNGNPDPSSPVAGNTRGAGIVDRTIETAVESDMSEESGVLVIDSGAFQKGGIDFRLSQTFVDEGSIAHLGAKRFCFRIISPA